MTELFGAPAYEQVADALRRRITSGELPLGAAIPSTRELCTEFGVSATSVRAAVAQLRTEGLVRGQPGKGVYVIATPQAREEKERRAEHLLQRVDDLEARITETADQLREEFQDELSKVRKQLAQVQAELINERGRSGRPAGSNQPQRSRARGKAAEG